MKKTSKTTCGCACGCSQSSLTSPADAVMALCVMAMASDGKLEGTCITTIRVSDNQAPAITCPGPQEYNAPPGACEALITPDIPVIKDNCTFDENQLNWTILHKGATVSRGTGFVPATLFKTGKSAINYSISNFPSIVCSQEITLIDNGCIDEDAAGALFIPEGFSPNDDGWHDYFKINGLGNYPNARIAIYTRQGLKIYEKENYGNRQIWPSEKDAWWDGRHSSQDVKVSKGNYIYILELGNNKVYKGTVMVLY